MCMLACSGCNHCMKLLLRRWLCSPVIDSALLFAQALAVGLSLTFVHAQMRVSGGALQQITNGEEESAASAQEQVVGVSALSLALSVQRVNAKRVEEAVFFRLVQATAVALFECGESEDYSPAKTLMNMCFTFYYEGLLLIAFRKAKAIFAYLANSYLY